MYKRSENSNHIWNYDGIGRVDMAKKIEEREETLEQNLEALEQLIQQLERENLTLDETFAMYKEGMARIQNCNRLIDRVEKELEILEEGGLEEDE